MCNQKLRSVNTFSIIGAGKVGLTFGKLLSKHLILNQIYDIDQSKKFLAKKHFNRSLLKSFNKIDGDIILIATQDSYIEKIAIKLSKIGIKNSILIHFSGALTSEIVKIDSCGALSIHPMASFTDIDLAIKNFKNHYLSIEGDKRSIDIFTPILSKITKNFTVVDKFIKPYLHLSSVIINNYTTALVSIAVEILNKQNINKKTAFSLLLPLLKDSYENILNSQSIENSITGPVKRGDQMTIEKHIKILKDTPQISDIYITLAKYLASKLNLDQFSTFLENINPQEQK